MKLRDKYPSLAEMQPSVLFRRLDRQPVFAGTAEIANYYTQELPLCDVYNFYGDQLSAQYDGYFPHLDSDTSEANISCLLPSHGSADKHRSGKYYSFDRNSGEYRPSVYCFKCQKLSTSLWLVFAIERERGKDLLDVFDVIFNNFRVAHPVDIVLDFDDEAFYKVQDDVALTLKARFNKAHAIRRKQSEDFNTYIAATAALLY